MSIDALGLPKAIERRVKSGEAFAEILTVTPEMAERWLEANLDTAELRNRKVSDGWVAKFARSMADNDWRLTMESIVFDETGFLLDGQTRLFACIEADTPFETLVAFNVTREAFLVMDSGRRRSAGDMLRSVGYSDPVNLAAAASLYFRYRNGTLDGMRSADKTPTHAETLALVGQHDFISFRSDARTLSRKLGGSAGAWMALLYLFNEKSESDREAFYAALATGAGMEDPNDPRLRLREQLMRMKADTRTRQMPGEHVSALAIKAWNLWRSGRDAKIIVFKKTESFPEVA